MANVDTTSYILLFVYLKRKIQNIEILEILKQISIFISSLDLSGSGHTSTTHPTPPGSFSAFTPPSPLGSGRTSSNSSITGSSPPFLHVSQLFNCYRSKALKTYFGLSWLGSRKLSTSRPYVAKRKYT